MRGKLVIRCILFTWALSLPISLGAESGNHWNPVTEGTIQGRLVSAAYAGLSAYHHCMGDLDADGDLDLLIASNDGRGLTHLPNLGTTRQPVWGSPQIGYGGLVLGSEYPECTCALADIDGDGDLDIFVMSRLGDHTQPPFWPLIYIENTGTATSPSWGRPQVNGWQGIQYSSESRPVFADVDSDGDLDLFIGNDQGVGFNGRLLFHENTGDRKIPQFNTSSILYTWPSQQSVDPSLGDIDGDGDLDIVAGIGFPPDGRPLRLFENTGSPSSPSWASPRPYAEDVVDYGECPLLVDYDGDGDLDLFSLSLGINREHASVFVLYENAAGPGRPAVLLPSRTVDFTLNVGAGRRGKSAFVDMDDDGDLDMFLLAGTLQYYQNIGNPMHPAWDRPVPDYDSQGLGSAGWGDIRSIALTDIDGDGDQDLFAAKYAGSTTTIDFYRNIGTPENAVWDTKVENYGGLTLPTPNEDITFADIDGDGNMDLFGGQGNYLGNYDAGGGTIDFYQNIGTPSNAVWASVSSNYAGVNVVSFAAPAFGDVDNDGDLDLVIGRGGRGAPHILSFVENLGSKTSPIWGAQVDGYAGIWAPWDSKPVFADLTGDGLSDMIVTATGLQFFCNSLSTLSAHPASQTILPSSSINFAVSGASGETTFTLVRNSSGGTIDAAGHYVAGGVAGGIDIVEVRDLTGKIGRAYINVISPSQVSASGKAVVIAGRKADDPLWTSTNNLAHYVFRTLLYRGFSKENVQYLNPQTGQDVDGNGNFSDDIDGASSLSAAQQALTTFAQGSPNLFVYMIDHGEADALGANGRFRLNETELLSASQLDGWLDALQSSGGVTTLTLVVDCCQAGSFLAACSGAPAGKARVVVASATATQPAFFSAGGLISFTNSFVGALCSGLTVGQAFDLAAGGMDRYQQPALDDDGDGVYDKDRDGAVARRLGVGASFIAGADRPQIGKISANQSLMGGDAHATIWASDVSAVYPVDRVWATIAAPGFISDAQFEPGQPVTGLPELELAWNAAAEGGGRYEATTNTFTQMGAYAVNIYAEDIWGGVAYPKQTYVNQTNSDERMAIVCGNGAYDTNSPWTFSDYLAASVYETARARWLAHDKIAYLTSAADSSQRPVDGASTKANLQSAIADAAGMSKLTVYLVGRGSGTAFDIDGDGAASDPDDVTPAELAGWLDAAQSIPTSPTLAVVVLDFTGSGTWVAPLLAPSGKKRIVITSCSDSEESWCEGGGVLSFTQWFFSKVFNGVNLRDAFNWSRLAIRAVTGETQNPTLDDDGSGVADRNDGLLAKGTYIGAAFVTGAEAPVIGDYARDIVLASNSATLWASGVWSPDGIQGAYAYVIKPGATPANDQVDRVDLAYNAANGRWEATYSSFDPTQYHRVVYFAEGRGGELSPPYNTLAGPSPQEDIYDRLYNDNTTATLNFISAGNWSQKHNLWMPGDEDWVVFNADANHWYSILVANQFSACDAAIYLYRASDLTKTVFPGGGPRDDNPAGGPDEMISWWSGPTSETMFVKVTQSPFSPGLSGDETSYTLEITGDWGASAGLATISGTVNSSVGPGGGVITLPSAPPAEGSAGMRLAGEPVPYLYSKHKVSFPAGALDQEYNFDMSSLKDINPPWYLFTTSWVDAHTSGGRHNASAFWLVAGREVTLLKPIQVTVQFVNNGPDEIATVDGGTTITFPVDDVPDGYSTADMRVFQWTFGGWEIVPGEQIVNGDTVTATVTQLYWDAANNVFASVFAAAPGGLPPEPPVLRAKARHWELFE